MVDLGDKNSDITDPKTWKEIGNEHFIKGKYEDAIKCYAHAIELDPNYLEGWNNLGVSLLKLGRIEEARVCNNKVKSLKGSKNNTKQKKQSSSPKSKKYHLIPIIFVLLGIGIVIIFLLSGGIDSNQPTPDSNYVLYENSTWGFSILRPDDSSVIHDDYVNFLSEKIGFVLDFGEIESKNIDWDVAKENIRDSYKEECTILDEKNEIISGYQCWVCYLEKDGKLTNQYLIDAHNRAYLIRIIQFAADDVSFSDICQHMIGSFSVYDIQTTTPVNPITTQSHTIPTTKVTQIVPSTPVFTEPVYSGDLSSVALTIYDLPNGWIKPEAAISTSSEYSVKFVSLNSAVLDFTVKRYSSVDDAKRAFLNAKSSIVDPSDAITLKIGDEAYGLQTVSISQISFRNKNLIVIMGGYPSLYIPVNDMIPYAVLANSRIK